MEFLRILLESLVRALTLHTGVLSAMLAGITMLFGDWLDLFPDLTDMFALLDSSFQSFGAMCTAVQQFFGQNSLMAFVAYMGNFDLLFVMLLDLVTVFVIAFSIASAVMFFFLGYGIYHMGIIWMVRALKVASLSTVDLTK